MKKICEIDSQQLFEQYRIQTWNINISKSGKFDKRRKVNPEWIKIALTPAQQKFIENRDVIFRPHPRRIHLTELFINETSLDSRDWTVLYLLFNKRT